MIPPPAYQGGRSTVQEAFVYLLRSQTSGRFYLGSSSTRNLDSRLDQRNSVGFAMERPRQVGG